MRQFPCVPTTYVTEIRKPTLKYTFIKNHIHKLCPFKMSQSANQHQNTIWQIVYIYMTAISNFDFMNFAFAKLVLACM